MKIDRLIGILAILLQEEKVTAPYLAKQFEVSRRTINRDIEALCQAGIPITTIQGVNGGISIMEGYRIDRTLLTAGDMQAVLAGLRSLDSVSGTNRYGQLMEKLSAGASRLLAGDQCMLIDLSSWYKDSLAPKIEMIHAAIERQEWIVFRYHSPKGERKRRVEPYNLVFQWSSWYLWGWCEDRKDFRLFKLNRMTELAYAGRKFEKRPVPLPELSADKIFPRNIQVKAVFEPTCRWRLIEEFGEDSFCVQEDGKLLFSFYFSDQENLLEWLLTFGGKVELLEPKQLRKELYQIAKSMEHRYLEHHGQNG